MSYSEIEYQREYRRRPEVLARDRARKAALRAAPGGKEKNLAAAQRTYAKPESYSKKINYNRRATRDLLDHYVAKELGLRIRDADPAAMAITTEIKREQLRMRRAVVALNKAIAAAKAAQR